VPPGRIQTLEKVQGVASRPAPSCHEDAIDIYEKLSSYAEALQKLVEKSTELIADS